MLFLMERQGHGRLSSITTAIMTYRFARLYVSSFILLDSGL